MTPDNLTNMTDAFRQIVRGIQLAAEGQAEIVRGLDAAITAQNGIAAEMRALHQDIADLRDTVSQLQQIVMQQSADLRALRARLEGQ